MTTPDAEEFIEHRTCTQCGRRIDLDRTGRFVTHRRDAYAAADCPGSGFKVFTEPTPVDRPMPRPGRSVWAISGGLPTLGKKR